MNPFFSFMLKKLFIKLIISFTFMQMLAISVKAEDYFPLQVGNMWVYELITGLNHTVETIGITEIDETKFYEFTVGDFPGSLFFRRDTLNQIIEYSRFDSSEHILYKLSATLGEKWDYMGFASEFTGTTRVDTPAGRFENCLCYFYDEPETGIFMVHYLAPDVGLVIQLGENWGKRLIWGYVNGVFYGDSTHVTLEGTEDYPSNFVLHQNFPNPFNTSTNIKFSIPDFYVESANKPQIASTLTIYNILGQKVKTLCCGYLEPGIYRIQWNGKDDQNNVVSSGTYFYLLEAGNWFQMKKMAFLK